MNLKWIDDIIETVPDTITKKRNLIEIAGFPSWETVNSNLLAFYFDPKEDHGFENLFIDSLIELMFEKGMMTEGLDKAQSIQIEREWNRIDILITGYDEEDKNGNPIPIWTIIIENKINADLYNDLQGYWSSIECKTKHGIVLSLNKIDDSKKLKIRSNQFYNILHKELAAKVQSNLAQAYIKSNDRHLLFLKEFILNIDSHYNNKEVMKNFSKTLTAFYDKRQEIRLFNQANMEMLRNISDITFDVMKDFGFEAKNSVNSSKGKHFYPIDGYREKFHHNPPDGYRIFVGLGNMRYENEFRAHFELDGNENAKYGTKVKQELDLSSNLQYEKGISKGKAGSDKAGYQHIFDLKLPISKELIDKDGFEYALSEALTLFFNSRNKYIEKATKALRKVKR